MSKQQMTYSNTPEDLKQYITKDEFEAFYKKINAVSSKDEIEHIVANSHRNYSDLSEPQKNHIEFFIRSPEITPSINGYIAVAIPGNDDDIGLVGYIPAEIE
jgi:hypothetical protein